VYSRLQCATDCTGAGRRVVCDSAVPSSCSGSCQQALSLLQGYQVCY
jgi:hypothetical protein